MNKKTERINRLVEILKVRRYVPVKELSALLSVSEMTIRRDLSVVEKIWATDNLYSSTLYHPVRGFAKTEDDYNLLVESEVRDQQKEAIGAFAASLIEPNDIIILDTGSTTARIVPHIPENLDVTVLCYNINILMGLRRNSGIRMLFSGGNYHANTQMFECPEGIAFINGLRAQKVFVSAAGVHETLGVTCANSYEVPTKRAILTSSLRHILVADSEKFGAVRSAYFCALGDIDTIITDSGLSQEWRDRVSALGITLHLV